MRSFIQHYVRLSHSCLDIIFHSICPCYGPVFLFFFGVLDRSASFNCTMRLHSLVDFSVEPAIKYTVLPMIFPLYSSYRRHSPVSPWQFHNSSKLSLNLGISCISIHLKDIFTLSGNPIAFFITSTTCNDAAASFWIAIANSLIFQYCLATHSCGSDFVLAMIIPHDKSCDRCL